MGKSHLLPKSLGAKRHLIFVLLRVGRPRGNKGRDDMGRGRARVEAWRSGGYGGGQNDIPSTFDVARSCSGAASGRAASGGGGGGAGARRSSICGLRGRRGIIGPFHWACRLGSAPSTVK